MPSVSSASEANVSPTWPNVSRGAIALVRTAVPIAAVGLVNLAMTITDALMMADLDPRALAAGSIIGDIYSIFIQFAAGALGAYTPRIAAAFGSRDYGLVGTVAGEGVRTSIILGIGGAAFIASVPSVLLMAGMELPLPDAAGNYASCMAGTFGFMMIVLFARNIFPAMDCGYLPVYVLAASVPLNAFLNGVMMYGWYGFPEMGLAGAGASSLTVAVFMAVLFTAYAIFAPVIRDISIAKCCVHSHWYPIHVPVREMIFVGSASLCETGVFLVSTMMIGFFEMNAVPSHIAVFRMVAVTYVLSTGISQAITIHAARRKSDFNGLGSLELSALLLAFMAGPVVMALVNVVPASVFAVLHMDGSTVSQIAPFAGISACAFVPTLAIRGFLRAISDSFVPAIISLLGYWCVGFPAMFYLAGPAGQGASGVWGGLATGTAATAAMFIAYYAWKKVDPERSGTAWASLVALPSPVAEKAGVKRG